MRKRLTAGLLAIGLLASSLTPAYAIFGLGQCEKVKKQVLPLENLMGKVQGSLGYAYEQVYFKEEQKIWEPTPESVKIYNQIIKNDPIAQIWKLGTNNPKCFTNTQKIQIKSMKNSSYKYYFSYPVKVAKYKNTGQCLKLMQNSDFVHEKDWFFGADKKTTAIIDKCSLGEISTMTFSYTYKSLYSF